LAVDIVLILDGKTASWDDKTDFDGDKVSDWMEVVAIFKKYGYAWGGDWRFKDSPHFEKTFGYSTTQLKALPKDKNGYVIF
jgi:peptidoglycan L-alanyl-D-glutamate endopeptidase CwlK